MTGPSGRPIEANGFEHLSDAEMAGYLDRDITPEERRRVETHIDQCAPCRSELVALSRITHADTAARTVPPRRHRWWIPAAAAATIGALLVPRLTIHEPAPDTPTRTRRIGETDGRSRLAIVSPDDGSTAANPRTFTWRAGNADVYHFVLTTESGGAVWTAETTDTTIALPDSVSLQSGRAYYWRVDGIGNGIAATTGSHRLQIPRE